MFLLHDSRFLVLHPRYKLTYFRKTLNYTRSWVDGARKLVREEYDSRYASLPLDDESEDDKAQGGSSAGIAVADGINDREDDSVRALSRLF